MPTYVYKFVDTGETIEVQQAFTDDALTEAPHPADGTLRPVRKVFTPVGITFKGNGFYKTDSRGKSSSSGSASHRRARRRRSVRLQQPVVGLVELQLRFRSSSSSGSSSGSLVGDGQRVEQPSSGGHSTGGGHTHSHGGHTHSH